jgi:hypothetical protein
LDSITLTNSSGYAALASENSLPVTKAPLLLNKGTKNLIAHYEAEVVVKMELWEKRDDKSITYENFFVHWRNSSSSLPLSSSSSSSSSVKHVLTGILSLYRK